MAVTENTYTGNGSTDTYSFTFPYLDAADIKVSLNGTPTTAYTLATATTIQFNTAPANGVAIRIYRVTDDAALNATFISGSAIRAQDLNNNFTQNLYVTQESGRDATEAITTAESAVTTANSAVTTANTAVSTANSAVTTANSAVSTANSAVSTANSAVTTANSAVTTANTAVSTANSAVTTANTASANASAALTAAAEALAYTVIADVAAIPVAPANGDAVRILDSTGVESFTPLSSIPVGFTGDPGLTVEIYYDSGTSSWVWVRYYATDPELRYIAKAGDTMTGALVLDADPTANLGAATKQYVDTAVGNVPTDAISEGNTSAEVIDTGSDGRFVVTTEGVEALRVDSSQRVGIGTTSPTSARLDVREDVNYPIRWGSTSAQFGELTYDTNAAAIRGLSGNALILGANGGEKARIDTSGRLLVGTSSVRSQANINLQAQIEGVGTAYGGLGLIENSNNSIGSYLILSKSRGTTAGSSAIVANGDRIGSIWFTGADGTDINTPAALIAAEVDGTPGANDMPGRLVFSTTADGASSPTERMRINESGRVMIGSTSTTSGSQPVLLQVGGGADYFHVERSSSINVVEVRTEVSTTNSRNQYVFRNPNGNVGSITTSGSSTAFNTSSDYRLKENVTPIADGIARLQQLKPSRFNFISDASKTVDGFLAHEVQTIVPEAVTGTQDEVEVWKQGEDLPDGVSVGDNKLDEDGNTIPVYQGIDQAKLVPLLTAALQEAVARIETLEAKVAALENP